MMNWKIIVGGLLIFAGIAQFLSIFTKYQYNNSFSMVFGLGVVFIGMIILGVFLVRQGRKES